MSEIDDLLDGYRRFVALPWPAHIGGPQKVWFVIYDPAQERRLRLKLPEFELATRAAGHGWTEVDLTDSFAHWMTAHRYREAYFRSPGDLDLALDRFTAAVVEQVNAALAAANETTIVGLVGAGALFGLTHVSAVIERAAPAIRGRLLVFFPGHYDRGNYRLLDARDGWNYHAVPITPKDSSDS